MLEHYYVKPSTIDRIRASWLGSQIESYVGWMEAGKGRADLIRMVPEAIGRAAFWVSLTGFAEIAISAGLQIPNLAPWTVAAAVAMLCCLFPANLKAAREHLTIMRRPVLPVIPRLTLQIIFIAALVAAVWPK